MRIFPLQERPRGMTDRPAKIEYATDAEGSIILHPLCGWVLAQAFGMTMILQIQYLTEQSPTLDKAQKFQIAVTPEQALELGAELQKAAERLLRG